MGTSNRYKRPKSLILETWSSATKGEEEFQGGEDEAGRGSGKSSDRTDGVPPTLLSHRVLLSLEFPHPI